MPWVNQGQPSVKERVVGGLCYLTFGLAGLLFIIISGRGGQSNFSQFHFLQSIVLWIINMLLGWASGTLILALGGIFGLLDSMSPGLGITTTFWVGKITVILVQGFFLLIAYGAIWAFLGKYAEIPFISNIVRQQMR